MLRFIKVGKRTAGHRALLEKKGYEVEEQDGVLQVTCSKVIEGTVDLSTPEKQKEVLTEVIAKKQVFSYTTEFKLTTDEGELVTRWGIMACTLLKNVSALVTKGAEAEAKPHAINDVFNAL